MARVYRPTKDGKALQNKNRGGPKEAKDGKGQADTTTAEGEGQKTEGEGE